MPRAAKENKSAQKPAARPSKASAAKPAPSPPRDVPHPLLAEYGLSRMADGTYALADAFMFKQQISRAMRRDEAREGLLSALSTAWSDPDELRAALQPTRVASPASSDQRGLPSPARAMAALPMTGLYGEAGVKESLVRLLLQCDSLQTALAQLLLQGPLAEHQEELESGPAQAHAGMALPKLILAQFRWLEHVVDGAGARSPADPSPRTPGPAPPAPGPL